MNNKLYEPSLMTGVIDADEEIIEGTLLPILNTFISLKIDDSFIILRTNEKGAICTVGSRGGKIINQMPFQCKREKLEQIYGKSLLYILPDSAVQDSWFYEQGSPAHNESREKPWNTFLRNWVKSLDSDSENRVSPLLKNFSQRHLAKPTEESQLGHYSLYNSMQNKDKPCLLIPRSRVLVPVLSNCDLLNKVEIIIKTVVPYKKITTEEVKIYKTNIESGSHACIGMLVSDKSNLPKYEHTFPEGIYTFTINYRDLNSQIPWSPHVKEHGLVISAPVQFSIKTISMEFAVVHLDPISLEDTILTQFPDRYSRTIAKVLDGDQSESSTAQLLSVLGDWKTKAEWVQNQYATGQKLLKPGDFYSSYKTLVKFAIDHSGDGIFPEWFVDSFKLCTGGIDYGKKYHDFLQSADNLKKIEKGLDALGAVRLKEMTSKSLTTVLTKANMETDFYRSISIAKGLEAKGEYAILEVAVNADNPIDFLTTADKIEKGFKGVADGVGLALSAVELATKVYNNFCSVQSVAQRRKDLVKLLSEYVELFQGGCSRDAMAVLERYRQALIASRHNCDKAALEMIYAGVNLALSAASLVPGLQFPAGVIILAKEGIQGAFELYKCTTSAIDKYLLNNWFSVNAQETKRLETIRKADYHSNIEIRCINGDDAVSNAQRQLHIRSEVINGLIELIERAGSKTEEKFGDAVLSKYRIDEYIRFFIMGEGGEWLYPKKPSFPISFGTLWNYYVPELSVDQNDFKTLFSKYTFASHGQTTESPLAAFWGPTSENKNAFKVNFGKLFPIHYISSGVTAESLRKFARTFSVNYKKVAPEFIEAVLVYYRSDPDGEWKPLWNFSSKTSALPIPPVTPLTQIRICVACKKSSDEGLFYPLTVKLIRMGYLNMGNCEGPQYKRNTYTLLPGGDFGLLETGPGAEYEKHFNGRQGAVIYPFYTFAGAQFCGLKPFQKEVFLHAERIHEISILASIEGSRAQRHFFPPSKPGEEPPKRRAEIPLVINTTNSTIGQSEKELQLQKQMLEDLNFIRHKSYNGTSQPALLERGKQFELVGYFFRKKGTWSYVPEEKTKVTCGLGDPNGFEFSWSQPFEMIVLFAINGINHTLRNSTEYSWRKAPLQLQWFQKVDGTLDILNVFGHDVNDISGPKYSTSFHYFGYFNTGNSQHANFSKVNTGLSYLESHGLNSDEVPFHNDIDSTEVYNVIKNQILTAPNKLSLKSLTEGWMFAGHFRFNYEIPGTRAVANALRPFGKINTSKDTYVEYTFKLSDEAVASSGKKSNLILKFRSPYISTLPAVWGTQRLSDNFLDTSKVNSAYLSLTDEILNMQKS